MQEFNAREIFAKIDYISAKADEIANILEKNDKLSFEDIKKISKLYENRKKSIGIINEFLTSDEGKEFVKNNQKEWESRISPFLKKDKKILDKLGETLNNLGDQIRQLNKQKNVLIYSKGYKK
jgi:oligoendopeptidase F